MRALPYADIRVEPLGVRSDRARVLGGYFEREPSLRGRRRELVRDVRRWVADRLERWRGRDRALHIYYPLAPRAPLVGSDTAGKASLSTSGDQSVVYRADRYAGDVHGSARYEHCQRFAAAHCRRLSRRS